MPLETVAAPPVPPSTAATPTLVLIGGDGDALRAALTNRRPAPRVVMLVSDAEVGRVLRADAARWIDDADERLAILAGPDYAGAADVAARFPDVTTAPVIVDSTFEQEHPEDVARARTALARLAFQSSANNGARKASAGRYLLQTLANAPRLAREANVLVLESLLAGMPAVIVSAGPSLDRNIHDLAPVADRVLIIACDTAARPLLSAGIEPHLIVATDSSRANAAHLSSLPASKSWLVAEGSLHPSAFTHFDGRTFAFRVADHEPWPWLQSLGIDAGRLDTWGSVATSALSLALMLGCGPIAFIGGDFAFTGGRPYCRGTSFEPQWGTWLAGGSTPDDIWRALVDRWPATEAAALDGTTVRTAPHLLSFRDWIVERTTAITDRRFINATGAGILAGPRIEQQSLYSSFMSTGPFDRNLLELVLSTAHATSTNRVAALFDGIDRLLQHIDAGTMAAWMDFAGGTVRTSAIESALRSHEFDAWALGRVSGT